MKIPVSLYKLNILDDLSPFEKLPRELHLKLIEYAPEKAANLRLVCSYFPRRLLVSTFPLLPKN